VKIPKTISILGSPESITWAPSFEKNPWTRSTEPQTILFDRSKWNASAAEKWLSRHSKKTPEVDETARYLRYRQRPPEDFQRGTFRTIPFGHGGIKAVIGVPKEIRKNPSSQTRFRSREFFLACNDSATILYLIHGSFMREIDRPSGIHFSSVFRLWSGFEPDAYYQFDLPATYALKKAGEADQICYQSDKWDGKLTHYFHDFDTRPDVYINRYTDPTIWAVKHKRGRRIVSAEGII
jgi:hypothetical protein